MTGFVQDTSFLENQKICWLLSPIRNKAKLSSTTTEKWEQRNARQLHLNMQEAARSCELSHQGNAVQSISGSTVVEPSSALLMQLLRQHVSQGKMLLRKLEVMQLRIYPHEQIQASCSPGK